MAGPSRSDPIAEACSRLPDLWTRTRTPSQSLVHVWSTIIGTERFGAVSSGTSFAQVVGAILRKQTHAQNPDKTPMAGGRHEG